MANLQKTTMFHKPKQLHVTETEARIVQSKVSILKTSLFLQYSTFDSVYLPWVITPN